VGRISVDENIGLGGFAMNEPRELSEPSPGQPWARSDQRRSVWRWIGALVVLGLVGLAVVHPRDSVNPLALVCTGYLFGTMLSLTTLSAAWAVVGSGKLARRMMLSAILVAAVVVAIVINMTLHEPSEGALLFLIVFGIVLGGQWLFAQVPLWFLAIAYGLRLTSLHGETSDAPRMTRQFGIRQLMVVTAVVAVVLGIGRLLVGWLLRDEGFLNDAGEGFFIIGFIAASGVVCILPLVLAMLMSRGAAIAALASLVFVGLVTWAELPVLQAVSSTVSPTDKWMFAAINTFQAAWVLAITALLRWGGYRLTMKSAAAPAIG
jgi:hypothetical protein